MVSCVIAVCRVTGASPPVDPAHAMATPTPVTLTRGAALPAGTTQPETTVTGDPEEPAHSHSGPRRALIRFVCVQVSEGLLR